MSKINTRSPYFITISETDLTSATVDLYIYTGTQVGTMDSVTYSLDSDSYNDTVTFEISQLIADYLDINYSGISESQVVWVNVEETRYINEEAQTSTISQYIAFDGYGYFEDGANPQLSSRVLQSNTNVITLASESWLVPIQQDELTQIDLKRNGSIIDTQTFTSTSESSDVVRYVGYNVNNYFFEDDTDYLFEDLNTFVFSDADADELLITYSDLSTETISVKYVEECKHEPYRLTFINKFGVLQSVWMFKRSDVSMSLESDDYKAFLVNNSSYDTSNHQYRTFHTNAKETISLSSGFYTENYNEIFRQMALSEKIWIYYNNTVLPVNIKSKELSFKTQVNDKLIDYKFEFEFAFDKINNVY